MSILSDFINEISGKSGSKRGKERLEDRLRELDQQTIDSSSTLRNLLGGLQNQIGSDVSGYTNKFNDLQKNLSSYLAGLPRQETLQRGSLIANLQGQTNTALQQALQGQNTLSDALRAKIQGLFGGEQTQLQGLLQNRNQQVLTDLDKYLSGASVQPAEELQAQLASRGISSSGGAYASALARLMAGLGEQKFNVQNQLSQNTAQQLIDLIQGRTSNLANLEQGFTDVGRGNVEQTLQNQMGLAQTGANLTREDQNAQRQREMDNYLRGIGFGREDLTGARGIQNTLKYQAPINLESQLQNILIQNRQNRIPGATQDYLQAKQNQQQLAGLAGAAGLSFLLPTGLGGFGGFGKIGRGASSAYNYLKDLMGGDNLPPTSFYNPYLGAKPAGGMYNRYGVAY